MKKLFILAFLLTLFTSMIAQKIQLRTTTGEILTYGDQSRLTTTDSATHVIGTIVLNANTAGMFEVSVSASDSAGNAVTGAVLVRYNKKAGTLTLGSPATQLATVTDASLGSATWNIGVSSNNFVVTVKGKLGITIRWRCLIKQVFP